MNLDFFLLAIAFCFLVGMVLGYVVGMVLVYVAMRRWSR